MTTQLVLTGMLKDFKIAQVSEDGTDGKSYMTENISQFLMKHKEI